MTQTHSYGSDQSKSNTDNTTKSDQDKETKTSGVNKDVWAEAERTAASQAGGFSGLDDKAKKEAVQRHYDQLMDNAKQQKDSGFDAISGKV